MGQHWPTASNGRQHSATVAPPDRIGGALNCEAVEALRRDDFVDSERFFSQLVEFFAPDLYAIIDWSVGYEFLEQELREMLRAGLWYRTPPRFAREAR